MATLICPRCLRDLPSAPEVEFCPHCGLANVRRAASDSQPISLQVGDHTYQVLDRLAVGSFATVYRCKLGSNRVGLLKIVRDAQSNSFLKNEVRILQQLGENPFLPRIINSFEHDGAQGEAARQVNVLDYDRDISEPAALYTLHEIQTAYPQGLDPKDVAWIWRRLLSVLAYCHGCQIAHSAVLPGHVLIEPSDHKLLLIDWCFASRFNGPSHKTSTAFTPSLRRWFQRDGIPRTISSALDISLAARCMAFLLTDDPNQKTYPEKVDPAIRRHFDRCIDLPDDSQLSASQLLLDFDKLIAALWGPRQFRTLNMPPRSKG